MSSLITELVSGNLNQNPDKLQKRVKLKITPKLTVQLLSKLHQRESLISQRAHQILKFSNLLEYTVNLIFWQSNKNKFGYKDLKDNACFKILLSDEKDSCW